MSQLRHDRFGEHQLQIAVGDHLQYPARRPVCDHRRDEDVGIEGYPQLACLTSSTSRSASSGPIERLPIAPLLLDAWGLRHNLNSYDSLYVALARRLDCPLITADRRLAAAPGLGVPLIVVSQESS